MTRNPPNGRELPPFSAEFRKFGFEPSWVGPSPAAGDFCLGSEDGRLLFTDEAGIPIGPPVQVADSGEAINGVAASGKWIAVSTRQEVIVEVITPSTKEEEGATVLPYGAHGVGVAPGGFFVAPLGCMGIMMFKPGPRPSDPVGSLRMSGEGMYFYRVLALAGTGDKDTVITACRKGGVGSMEFRWGEPKCNLRTSTFKGLDVVDVCVVPSYPASPTVVGVGLDGTLVFFRDALHDQKPVTMKFDTVQGTAYRLLNNGNHLFLLTSQGLYALMNLVGQLREGRTKEKTATSILAMPMEAVDANLVAGRWLLVITPDEVLKLDVELIEQSKPTNLLNGEMSEAIPRTLAPEWEVHGVPQTSTQLAGIP
jgi:hypothetical protein